MKFDVSPVPSLEARRREHHSREDISLRELGEIFWRGKWILIAITLALTVAAGAAAVLLPKHYMAKVVVMPVTKDPRESGLGSAMAQFSSLASLAGLSGIGAGGMRAEALATLESEALTEKYIKEQDLLPILFANKWDKSKKVWTVTNPKKVPTLWKGNEYFEGKVRRVGDDKKTGMITVAVTWTDAKLAAKWANDIVDLTNDYMRQKAIREAQANMAYLSAQAQQTNIVEMRQTIYTIMQGELKNAMLAEGNREFALKVIDPAVPPERPASPEPILWTVGGFAGGLLVSCLYLIAREGWGKRS